MVDWLVRRVQPLKLDAYLAWQYSGEEDLTRESVDSLPYDKVRAGLHKVFESPGD